MQKPGTRQQVYFCAAAEAILEVACSTFGVESACVAVTEGQEKVFFWAGRGICTTGTHSVWAQQFVTWALASNNHEVAIVEDASTDARFGPQAACSMYGCKDDAMTVDGKGGS